MLCQCGCGEEVKEGNKYVNGHNGKGKIFSKKSRKKMSEAAKGKHLSEATKKKISEAGKGNQFAKGFKHSKKTKRKIGLGNKGKGLGKHLSEEHKKKISEAHKGKIVSEETKRKLSEAGRGNKNSLGHRHSEEARKKISESQIIHGRDFILKKHKKYKKEECLFECGSEFYVLHHEPPVEEDILNWEGQLINLCKSCHQKAHHNTLKLPDTAGIKWTKKDIEKVLRRE